MKTCKVCKAVFKPFLSTAKVCSPDCARSLAVSIRGKAEKVAQVKERKADKVKRESLKRRSDWIAEAQAAFNLFIRTRDAGLPCICCGRNGDSRNGVGGTWDAGHYRSRGSAPHLRFDERNVHAQLKQCNRYDSGNVVGYRMGLIARIGQEALDALEADQEPRRHTIDDLREIKREYTAKAKELKGAQT